MTTHDLIGLWSAMHGHHSTMEDEQPMFGQDSSGWYESARPWYSEFVLFSWLLEDHGRIRLHLHSQIEVSEQPRDEFVQSEDLRGEEVLEIISWHQDLPETRGGSGRSARTFEDRAAAARA